MIDHFGVTGADLGGKLLTFEEMYSRLTAYSKAFREAATPQDRQTSLATLGAWARKSILDKGMNIGPYPLESSVSSVVKESKKTKVVMVQNVNEAVGHIELAVLRVGTLVISGATSGIGKTMVDFLALLVRIGEDLKLETIKRKAADATT